MSIFYVGLDVHSKMTEYAVEDAAGTLISQGRVPTTPEGLRLLVTEHRVAPGTRVGCQRSRESAGIWTLGRPTVTACA